MIYTSLPGLSLDVLANHAPSTDDWNRLLRTGAEFVVKINVSVLAIHNGEQQVLGVPMVPFTVRGGVASSMRGLMHLLQMQVEHTLEVTRYEASGYTLVRILMVRFSIATDPAYSAVCQGPMPPGPVVAGGAHVKMPKELADKRCLFKP